MNPDQRDLSPERHASLEQRIRQRVVDRCVAAARMALAQDRFGEAEASLAEAALLDANHPDIQALSAALVERRNRPVTEARNQPAARQPRARLSAEMKEHRNQPMAVPLHRPATRQARTWWWPPVAIAILAFAAGWATMDRIAVLLFQPHQLPTAAAALPHPALVDRSTSDPAPAGVPTAQDSPEPASGGPSPLSLTQQPVDSAIRSDDPESAEADGTEPAAPFALAPAAELVRRPSNELASAADTKVGATAAAPTAPDLSVRPAIATPPADLSAAAEATTSPAAAASPLEPSRTETLNTLDTTGVVAPLPERVPPVSESLLVDRALQRYRAGYDRLDADLVQAVYPAVDRSPLARAFKDLASQSLVFEACDVDIRGALANATCRGTASYVPRIGTPEPRVEHRVWTFTLRRGADDWTIERARTSQ